MGPTKLESYQRSIKESRLALEMDGGARNNIVVLSHLISNATTAVGDTNTPNRHIEEAVWEPTQVWHLSMTQQSHEVEGDSRRKSGAEMQREVEESQLAENTPAKNTPEDSTHSNTQTSSSDALEGIGAQGGRIHVHGGGTLKSKTRMTPRTPKATAEKKSSPSSASIAEDQMLAPISFMSVEIHVQCRTGFSRLDSKRISMAPDSSKDKIFAIVYVYGIDPGGGEKLQVLERCCLFVKFPQENTEKSLLAKVMEGSMPRSNLGTTAPLHVECLDSEKKLLLRFSSLVIAKDPDLLLSWDPQSTGLAYVIERALPSNNDGSLENQAADETTNKKSAIDMIRLLGRTPFASVFRRCNERGLLG